MLNVRRVASSLTCGFGGGGVSAGVGVGGGSGGAGSVDVGVGALGGVCVPESESMTLEGISLRGLEIGSSCAWRAFNCGCGGGVVVRGGVGLCCRLRFTKDGPGRLLVGDLAGGLDCSRWPSSGETCLASALEAERPFRVDVEGVGFLVVFVFPFVIFALDPGVFGVAGRLPGPLFFGCGGGGGDEDNGPIAPCPTVKKPPATVILSNMSGSSSPGSHVGSRVLAELFGRVKMCFLLRLFRGGPVLLSVLLRTELVACESSSAQSASPSAGSAGSSGTVSGWRQER